MSASEATEFVSMLTGAVSALKTAMDSATNTSDQLNTIKEVGLQAATKIETIETANRDLGFMYKRYGTCMFKNEYFDADQHQPFLLACGHVICRSCIGKTLRDERTGGKLFSGKCPICKGPSQFTFHVPFFTIPSDVLPKLQVQLQEIPVEDVIEHAEIAKFAPLGDRAVEIATNFIMQKGTSKKTSKFGKSKRVSRKKKI